MHKKYLAKSKLMSKEFAEFNKSYLHVEKLLQKNHSGHLYLDTYGNETESTQALDTPKKKEKDLFYQMKQSNFLSNNNEFLSNNNAKVSNLIRKKSNNFNYHDNENENDNFPEDEKTQKTKELKKMINRISLNKIPSMKNYSNVEDECLHKQEFDENEGHELRTNLDPKQSQNSQNDDRLNSNLNRGGYNTTNKNVKFHLDGSLTVINERDSSSERILETGERFLRKLSDDKKNKKMKLSHENKSTIEGERVPIRKKLEKCNLFFFHNLNNFAFKKNIINL